MKVEMFISARRPKAWNLGRVIWPGLVAMVLLPIGSAGALSVRVDTTNGAPRLLVDGKPVRARMFFGIPGSAPIAIAAGPRQMSFDFNASESSATATMHFRFRNQGGDG